ncbi:MAG: DUF502 domain-containing protein [candidate division Zixibacteria bacterium]|nr:DUF502 domain-containing protein [candidate division Zixibacteria bacterium]
MKNIKRRILDVFRRQFLSGVIVIVPLILTYFVLRFLFGGFDSLFNPLQDKLLGTRIPGLGILATLVLIYLVGLLAGNVIGSRLIRLWEILFTKTPLVKTVYSASKQLLEALTSTRQKSFQKVVLVQYPRLGSYVLGFLTKRIELDINDSRREFMSIFVPSTPTPFTGFAILLPKEDVIILNLPVEEALQFIVSGGIVSPERFLTQKAE